MAQWTSAAPDDPRLAVLRELPLGSGARTQRVIVEGELAVLRALASRHRVELVLAAPSAAARIGTPTGVELLLLLPEAEISTIVGYAFHRGCIAVLERPRATWTLPEGPRARVLALDRVADPANVGAIVRTARALAIDLLVLGRGCGDPWSRRAMRASMGAVLDQPLVDDVELVELVASARDLVWWAADADAASAALDGTVAPPRLAIVLGNEGAGITPEVRARCDASVRIPIRSEVDSLNVAAAAAILAWALR